MLEKKFPDYTIKISVDTTELDCAIEKTRQLVALMKEQQKLAASFFVSGGELRRIKERTNQNEKEARRLNIATTLLVGLAIISTIIAYLDKIIWLVNYVSSYLH